MLASVTSLDDRLYQIDAGMWDEPERLACYYYDTPEPVLVECGPTATVHHLLRALDELGVDDVATILVTHIHLDHAGAAGFLADRFPNARIGVHAVGAPHMVDPSRLLASATRIYGEDGMHQLWGSMTPVDPDRILVLGEGDTVPLGDGQLDVMYTPGHAKHHIVFHDDERGAMYVGDAVGVCFPHGHHVQPNTPPPDLDPPLLVEQLHRMARRHPAFLGFAHYGVHQDPQAAFRDAEARLDAWVTFVESLGATAPEEAARRLRERTIAGYRAEGVREDVIARYDQGTFWPMQAAGIQRWLRSRKAT